MARNYQRKKHNPYALPHNVYMQSLYIARDYDRLRQEQADSLSLSSMALGDRVQQGPGDPTAVKAEKIEVTGRKLSAIEGAIQALPQEYRQGVWENVVYQKGYPYLLKPADPTTWSRYRQKFLYTIAERLDYV